MAIYIYICIYNYSRNGAHCPPQSGGLRGPRSQKLAKHPPSFAKAEAGQRVHGRLQAEVLAKDVSAPHTSIDECFCHSLAPSASGNSMVIRAALASLPRLPFLGSAVTEPTSRSSRMPRCARVRENLTRQDLQPGPSRCFEPSRQSFRQT